MKNKILFMLLLFLFVSPVYAKEFSIDVSKINITDKSENLIFNKEYKLKLDGFDGSTYNDRSAVKFSKNIIEKLFSDDNYKNKRKEFLSNMYLDGERFDTLTSSISLESFFDDLNDMEFNYKYIRNINVSLLENGLLSTSYIVGEDYDIIINLYLKEYGENYKIYIAWINTKDEFKDYFERISINEDNGEHIGEVFNKVSIDDFNSKINNDSLDVFYNTHAGKNVSITALNDGGVSSLGSGFFIRKGIIVTSWSIYLKMLNTSQFLYVNDSFGNTYKIDGIVSMDSKYDVVFLKLNKEVGECVTFDSGVNYKDTVYMITSKNNTGFSVNYGNYLSTNKGKMKNMLAISSSDVGGALYNSEGLVVGVNTIDSLNNVVSVANSSKYLVDIQKKLNNTNFENIKSISDVKDNYYFDYRDESVYNNIPNKVFDEISKYGDLKNTILLNLVKGSYKDGIISLRYKTNIDSELNVINFSASYQDKLIEDDFELVYKTNDKRVFVKDATEIIIKEKMNYLLIIVMEI